MANRHSTIIFAKCNNSYHFKFNYFDNVKKECMARKTIRSSQIAIIGVSTGIVGWRIGIVLKNISAEYNVIIILICFTFVAAVFSIGFLNYIICISIKNLT